MTVPLPKRRIQVNTSDLLPKLNKKGSLPAGMVCMVTEVKFMHMTSNSKLEHDKTTAVKPAVSKVNDNFQITFKNWDVHFTDFPKDCAN